MKYEKAFFVILGRYLGYHIIIMYHISLHIAYTVDKNTVLEEATFMVLLLETIHYHLYPGPIFSKLTL